MLSTILLLGLLVVGICWPISILGVAGALILWLMLGIVVEMSNDH